jgi:hypothetical protein
MGKPAVTAGFRFTMGNVEVELCHVREGTVTSLWVHFPIREDACVTLPWIVALAALLYLVLWQSGLLKATRRTGSDPQPRRLKGKADPNRLKVFEDFLRNLQADKEDDSTGGDAPKSPD